MSGLPPNRSAEAIPTRIENHTASDGSPVEIIDYYQFVMGDYFETMGVPIVAGRGFELADAVSPGKVVIVNETLANRVWKGRSPIGQRVRPNLSAAIGFGGDAWHTVIGVAKDVKQGGVEKETGTELYVSLDQLAMAAPTMNVVLRTILPPAALSRTLERLVREVDPAVPIVRLRDMESVFAESIRRPRLLAQLLGAFAGLALLLAAVGTYGVLSYMATERRREIGIRIALGGSRSSVVAQVMTQGLQLTAIGLVLVQRLASNLLLQQLSWTFIAAGAFAATILIPRDITALSRFKWTWAILGILLLMSPLLPVIGREVNGARIWIGLGSVNFEPWEVVKILLVIFFAAYLEEFREVLAQSQRRFGPIPVPPVPYLVPIVAMWAIAMVVRPAISVSSASRMSNSVSVSTLDVASSRTRMRGSKASARANDSSCF